MRVEVDEAPFEVQVPQVQNLHHLGRGLRQVHLRRVGVKDVNNCMLEVIGHSSVEVKMEHDLIWEKAETDIRAS